MMTMAQRLEQLRTEKGMSRPELAAALGLPRMAVEKFETGRQTPTQAQQLKMAAYFDVPLPYLRGETGDTASMGDWMADGAFQEERPAAPAAPAPRPQKAAPAEEGGMFDAFLRSKKFQETLRAAVLDALRSPEGQVLLDQAVRRQSGK